MSEPKETTTPVSGEFRTVVVPDPKGSDFDTASMRNWSSAGYYIVSVR